MTPFSAERSVRVIESVTLALIKALSPLASSVERYPNQQQHPGQQLKPGLEQGRELERNPQKDQQKQEDKKNTRSKAKLALVTPPPPRPPPLNIEEQNPQNLSQNLPQNLNDKWVGIFSQYQTQRNAVLQHVGEHTYRLEAKNKGKKISLRKGIMFNKLVG